MKTILAGKKRFCRFGDIIKNMSDKLLDNWEKVIQKNNPELAEINDSKDFANWCRYSTTTPMITDASFNVPKVIARVFICGNWDEKSDKSVSALGIEEISREACIALKKGEEERKNVPEYGLLKILFGPSWRGNDNLENYYLVCLKEQTEDRGHCVSCFLSDKGSNHCVADSILVWQAEWLEEDLQKAFGSRNICIIS